MTNDKKELAVAALRNGTVIDHIPSDAVFAAVRILGLEKSINSITIGNNLKSRKLGSKGIIKVADTFFEPIELERIALIAPSAVVNIIRDYEVVEKYPISLPYEVTGIVRCPNPKCVTNHQPIETRFDVVDRDNVKLRCHYCNHTVSGAEAEIIQ